MWNKRFNKPLLWALALSLLAHLVLIGRLSGFEWPGTEKQPMLVQITPLPAPVVSSNRDASPQKRADPMPEPKPEPVMPEALPVQAPPPPAPVKYAVSEETIPVVPEAVVQESVIPPSDIAQVAEEVPVSSPSPVDVAEDEEQGASVQPESELKPPPNFVSIEFDILRKGSIVGTEHHVYDYGDNGYTLTSIAKPKGLLALALSDLVQKSEGKVTRQGLRPAKFSYQYGKDADKAQNAYFNWSLGKLFMHAGSRKQEVALTDGAQDLMSFMYQFMFVPPLQDMQLAITNGKRFKTYAYTFEGEETITTPFGKVNCLHIGRTDNDGEEKTELWLATDYHYLPLKISKTEKDGTVLERIATRVQIE